MTRVETRDLEVAPDGQVMLPPTSLTVGAGRALAVLGPNGSGKTTLLRVLAGQQRPTAGEALVDGSKPDARHASFRRTLGALIGSPPFARDLTLDEQLAFVATSWGLAASAASERATDLLERFGIGALAARYPHELSSGQTQLFALALTLARPFDVLLLDEPEQRLDADRLGRVADVLRGVVESGVTLVFASHSATLVEALADERVTVGR